MARKRKAKIKVPKFYIVNHDDGCETYIPGSGALIVPHETLNDELKEALDEDAEGDLFSHERFPALTLTDLLEVLQENDLLESLIDNCRKLQKDLEA